MKYLRILQKDLSQLLFQETFGETLLLRMVSFYLVGLTGLCLSATLLWLFIDKFGISAIPAKFGTIFFVTAMQYTLNKFIFFRKRRND